MLEVRDKEQLWLKKIEISRNNIQTNKRLSLIGAVVGLQQSSKLLCTLYFLVFSYRNIDNHQRLSNWRRCWAHMLEMRDREQPRLKKIEINRNNIQTNKQLSLIGAFVGLQQSHMNEQERQRASLDWNNQDKLEQSHIWRGDKETASIENARFNLSLRQLLVVQFHACAIGSKVNKLVFVSKKCYERWHDKIHQRVSCE